MPAYQQHRKQQHLRSTSNSTASASTASASSTGSSYQLILDHILTYPGSYEIPLRTMYTLNCAPRIKPMSSGARSPSSVGSSPVSSQAPWQDNHATQAFTDNLMAQIAKLPNQPTSLPPSFVTSFVQKCFAPELVDVDFPQALTGLDYLKDLETRRRREVAAAMSRLAIDRTTIELDGDSLAERYPGVLQWVQSINERERKVDALYTQVYVALRRWILINEMSLRPFSKHNCVAMLNTLYPPVISSPPTSRLTPTVLGQQRQGFFNYITSVEQRGPGILTNLMDQGKAPGEENGWPAAVRSLGYYLQLANSIINECAEIVDVHDISPLAGSPTRTPRKVDSGVSFNASEPLPFDPYSKPQSPSPVEPASRPKTPIGTRSTTSLEKLARGLKTIGRSRTNVTEMVEPVTPGRTSPTPSAAEKAKGLRKMRSLGALTDRKTPSSPPPAPNFDAEAMRLQRMRYEASAVASQKFGKGSHPEA